MRKKTNPTGSMKTFFYFRARKAARAREEIRAFCERRGVRSAPDRPLSPPVSLEASTSSSNTLEDLAMEREYAALLAVEASDEELLEWATRKEEWDFVS